MKVLQHSKMKTLQIIGFTLLAYAVLPATAFWGKSSSSNEANAMADQLIISLISQPEWDPFHDVPKQLLTFSLGDISLHDIVITGLKTMHRQGSATNLTDADGLHIPLKTNKVLVDGNVEINVAGWSKNGISMKVDLEAVDGFADVVLDHKTNLWSLRNLSIDSYGSNTVHFDGLPRSFKGQVHLIMKVVSLFFQKDFSKYLERFAGPIVQRGIDEYNQKHSPNAINANVYYTESTEIEAEVIPESNEIDTEYEEDDFTTEKIVTVFHEITTQAAPTQSNEKVNGRSLNVVSDEDENDGKDSLGDTEEATTTEASFFHRLFG